jgi:FAD:protein FMN transferase
MSALHRTQWRAVGTTCAAAVTAGSHDESEARRALDAAQDEVAACERELSRFDPTSDLSRLNAAGGRWTPIGRRLLEALDLALRAREETGGRFDPTVLPALAASGYDRSFELLEEREARWADDWRAGTAIELDPRNGRGRLERGTSVDLGGIGKGYAAGRALDAMVAASPTIAGGLVDLGGDIAVRGESPEGGPWLVAIADPRRAGETLAVLALDSGGVATSGRDARRFGPARSLHHLIDPETGESALAGPLTVTVVAPDPVAAEVHATTLAIAGPGEAEEHVSARPRISALYVPHAGPAIPLGSLPLASERLVVSAA